MQHVRKTQISVEQFVMIVKIRLENLYQLHRKTNKTARPLQEVEILELVSVDGQENDAVTTVLANFAKPITMKSKKNQQQIQCPRLLWPHQIKIRPPQFSTQSTSLQNFSRDPYKLFAFFSTVFLAFVKDCVEICLQWWRSLLCAVAATANETPWYIITSRKLLFDCYQFGFLQVKVKFG